MDHPHSENELARDVMSVVVRSNASEDPRKKLDDDEMLSQLALVRNYTIIINMLCSNQYFPARYSWPATIRLPTRYRGFSWSYLSTPMTRNEFETK